MIGCSAGSVSQDFQTRLSKLWSWQTSTCKAWYCIHLFCICRNLAVCEIPLGSCIYAVDTS
jgi:hypothetical protein